MEPGHRYLGLTRSPRVMPTDATSSPVVFAGFLVRVRKGTVAHYWTGADTACSMASTGGLNVKLYTVLRETSLPVCQMCLATTLAKSVSA